jgi:hypothetical protein
VLDQADRSLLEGRDDITIQSFTTRLRGLGQDRRLVRLMVADAGQSAAQTGTGQPHRF